MRRAARVDANQGDIVDALRRVYVSVEIIGKPVDLLVDAKDFCPHCHGPIRTTALMEVKTEDGTYTEDQVKFMARWPGKIHVARTPEEAVRLVLGEKAMA